MKLSREGNKIILEVEPEDCHGQPMEVVTDFIYEGMAALADPKVAAEVMVKIASVATLRTKLEDSTKRLKEKWEIIQW